MKKFMKSCGIAALLLIVIGFAAGTAAWSIQGGAQIEDIVSTVTGGRLHVNLGSPGIENWGVWFGDKVLDGLSGLDSGKRYELGEKMDFESGFSILTGNAEESFAGEEIDSLAVEAGSCHIVLRTSEDEDFRIDARNAGKMQCFVQNRTLRIKAVRKLAAEEKNDCEIAIYVPADFEFENADVEMGAGSLDMESFSVRRARIEVGAGRISCSGLLRAEELDLKIGAGEVLIESIDVGKLDAEVGMGELTVSGGSIAERADIECAMGGARIELTGSEKDYDYDLEALMGGIEIGSYSLGGFAGEKRIDNKAGREINMKCSMGEIAVGFTE